MKSEESAYINNLGYGRVSNGLLEDDEDIGMRIVRRMSAMRKIPTFSDFMPDEPVLMKIFGCTDYKRKHIDELYYPIFSVKITRGLIGIRVVRKP